MEEQQFTELPATERETYIEFHRQAYREDLSHADRNAIEFPRWSIISGYYCMHDVTKLFLAERFNVKVTSPDIHARAIEALDHFVKDKDVKARLLVLLKNAKDMYFSAERLKERTLPAMLRKGKQERGMAQYYCQDYSDGTGANSQKALYFIDNIVRPYVAIVEGLA
ncbi:MAG: hypothetical protein V1906_02625 [Candidatus Woesearchaeota archaeon]